MRVEAEGWGKHGEFGDRWMGDWEGLMRGMRIARARNPHPQGPKPGPGRRIEGGEAGPGRARRVSKCSDDKNPKY